MTKGLGVYHSHLRGCTWHPLVIPQSVLFLKWFGERKPGDINDVGGCAAPLELPSGTDPVVQPLAPRPVNLTVPVVVSEQPGAENQGSCGSVLLGQSSIGMR